jgi:hypothetical protein
MLRESRSRLRLKHQRLQILRGWKKLEVMSLLRLIVFAKVLKNEKGSKSWVDDVIKSDSG